MSGVERGVPVRPRGAAGRRARAWIGCGALALLAPLLFGAYSRWPALAFLGYFMLLPWTLLYTDDRAPRRSTLWFLPSAYVTWLALYPQVTRYGTAGMLALALIFMLPWVPFPWVMRSIHRAFRWPRAITLPLVWVAAEWFRTTVSLAHIDFYRLGASQARFPLLIQVADVTGVYGLSFLVAAVTGLMADALFAWRDRGFGLRSLVADGRVRAGALAVAGLLVAVLGYGAFRLETARQEEGPKLAGVQPNVAHTIRNAVGVHLAQMRLAEREIPAGEVDLIVFPENAVLDFIQREGAYLDDLRWLGRTKRAPMLVGALGEAPGRPGKTTNVAYLLDEQANVIDRYTKILLFPYGEYIPFDDWFRRNAPEVYRVHRVLARAGWGFLATGTPGKAMNLLHMPWRGGELPLAVLICNENTYPPIPTAAGRLGARLFVNITSEGSVGGPVQEQLLRMCMLRAVENRIPYVRVGNTGITCVIDAQGRMRQLLRGHHGGAINDVGVMIADVPLSPGGRTLYSRSGDAFAKACVGLALLLGFASLLRWRRGAPRAVEKLALAALTLTTLVACHPVPHVGHDPGAARAAFERCRDRFARGPAACDETIDLVAAACADPEICEQALPYAADCFNATGRIEAGVVFFGEIVEAQPTLVGPAEGYRAFFLDRAGYLGAAAEAYRRSLEAAPKPEIWLRLGRLQSRLGQNEQAAISFERANARFQYGRSLRRNGNLEEAERQLEAVVAGDRRDQGPAWVDLGRIREQRGLEDQAVSAFRRAIEVDTDNIEARFMLARRALRRGDDAELDRLIAEIQTIEATLGRGPRPD